MKRFCLLANKSKDPDFKVSGEIEKMIIDAGGECTFLGDPLENCNLLEGTLNSDSVRLNNIAEIPLGTECVIVLGGDGTIIETARTVGNKEIPIVGINLGTLGFLSVIEKNDAGKAIIDLIEDRFIIEKRMLLRVTSFCGGKTSRCMALNDVTVTRSGLSRMIRTDLYLNDELVGPYYGDGILVSTPTGSTGYNLSAGGPIVTPEAELMCVTPICPHTLHNRSIIVSANDRIKIVIGEKKKSQETESFATIDGQMALRLNCGDYILVEKADTVTKLIRFPGQSYFNLLHSKLNG